MQQPIAEHTERRTIRTLCLFFIPAAVFLSGLVYFSMGVNSRYGFPLDDSWIHRVYARSFAFGHGFEYNAGTQEAGATSPLWVIVSSPAHWLEHFGTNATIIGVKAIGALLGLFALWMVIKIALLTTHSLSSAVIAATLFALEPRLLFSALSGMETNLLLALWLGAAYAFAAQRWFAGAVLVSILPVTRPEALVLLPLFLVALFIYGEQIPLRRRLLLCTIVFLPICLWSIFCRQTTGHWLPNTYYLKAQVLIADDANIRAALLGLIEHGYAAQYIFFLGLGIYVLQLYRRSTLMMTAAPVILMVFPLFYLMGLAGSRRIFLEGYYWSRWIDPPALILTAAFCVGFAVIFDPFRFLQRVGIKKARSISPVVMALGALAFVLSAPSLVQSLHDRRSHLESDSRAIDIIDIKPGQWIGQNTALDAVVAVNDAGAIRYFGNRQTIDLEGLNNKERAFGTMSYERALETADYLVIFPGWIDDEQRLTFIGQHFDLLHVFRIPTEEYTVCNCPSQTTKAILKKKMKRKA